MIRTRKRRWRGCNNISLKQIAAALLIGLISGCAAPPTLPTATPAPPSATVSLVSTAAATGPAILAANAAVYAMDTHQSLIKYLATGPFNAQFPGTFAVTGQTIILTPVGDGDRVTITLTFDLKSATATDSFMRSTLLNSLEVDKYPVATLTLASQDAVHLPPDSTPVTFTAAGTFDLHGQQHAVEVPITLTTSNGGVTANGSMAFNLSDYNISISRLVVSDQVTFTAHLVAAP